MRSLVMVFFAAAIFLLGSIVQAYDGTGAYQPGRGIVDLVTIALPVVFLIAALYFYQKDRAA